LKFIKKRMEHIRAEIREKTLECLEMNCRGVNVISDRDYRESGMYAKEQAEVQTVPIQCKVALTIKEAAEYSNIGINKLESILRSPRCPFVLYVGKKKLVKRKEFEKFISDNIEI